MFLTCEKKQRQLMFKIATFQASFSGVVFVFQTFVKLKLL